MPRDWNQAYEDNDTPWDKGYAAPPLVEFLDRYRIEGEVLVPGCGSGHDVRQLARHGAVVTGLDIAPGALEKARRFPSAGSERYVRSDFLNLEDVHYGVYDWVVEHTCLCAIEPADRASYAASLKRALRPGGGFLAIFFREVPDYSGDGPPHPISEQEVEQLFGGDFELLGSFVPQRTYPSRPVGCEEVCWLRLWG